MNVSDMKDFDKPWTLMYDKDSAMRHGVFFQNDKKKKKEQTEPVLQLRSSAAAVFPAMSGKCETY